MKTLLTGGAGFIGRWTLKRLLERGDEVVVVDNLSNGKIENIEEFLKNDKLTFIEADLKDNKVLENLFSTYKFDRIYHLAASIVVQDSIDNPRETFENDVMVTFNLLEYAKKQMFGANGKLKGDKWIIDKEDNVKETVFIFMSTCMVYAPCSKNGIDEFHPTDPVSPYGASKIAAENMVLSYFKTYKLPTVVIRPFNTYGPYQKSNGEGGVVPIFVKRAIENQKLMIYGEGEQTRDLMYVEDCADFIIKSGEVKKAYGEIINAGSGEDITINELAKIIADNKVLIEHIPHIHPQSEIQKLLCNPKKAKDLLNWEPKVFINEGISKLKKFIIEN